VRSYDDRTISYKFCNRQNSCDYRVEFVDSSKCSQQNAQFDRLEYCWYNWLFMEFIIMIYIFDLDGTVIDSSHRQLALPNGDIDLTHWRENSTKEKIFRDELLPLARYMKRAIANPNTKTAICTARNLGKYDYQYLQQKNLVTDFILSRQNGDDRPDADMKREKIFNLLVSLKIPRNRWKISATIFDDNKSVLRMAKNDLNIISVNATKFNERIIANA
jgi:FMN phosphatase YigB (HAD superfamily)